MKILTEIKKALSIRSASDKRDIVDMSGANSIFGTIAKASALFNSDMDFIPMDNEGGVMKTSKGVNPQWLGLGSHNMQYWAYKFCPPLASVIDRISEAGSNGKIEFRDEDGNTIKSSFVNKSPRLKRIKKLLINPNPWQTYEEWNSQQDSFARTYGYCLVWGLGATIDKTMCSALINIPPNFATPIKNDNFDIYNEKENNPISKWRVSIFGISFEIDSKDVLVIKDGYINYDDTLGLPLSKVAGLDYSISNICAAMEADNVLLKKKGPLGVFSHEGVKDPAGITPMTQEVQDDLQKQLQRYGLTVGQLQYVISRTGLKWNAMSFNLRDLMTKETVRQCIDNICDRFGYPAELMSGKNATYENRSSAERFLYQTVVIPFSLRKTARYNKFFDLEDIVLYRDFQHLPVLQEDILKAGQASEANSASLNLNWTSGIITWNEYRVGLKMDKVSGGDIYYPEWLKANPEMNITKPEKNKNADKEPSKDK